MRIIIPFLFLASCAYNVNLKNVDLNPLLTDNNSKIWLISKVVVDDRNIGPTKLNEQSVIIFYNSNKYIISKVTNIGGVKSENGTFDLNSEKSILKFNSDKRNRQFDLTYVSEERIMLSSIDSKGESYEIIPFPEY